jgi:putative FmdB family regulatory protein
LEFTMPLYEYQCRACGHGFEALVRSDSVPACPLCASTELNKAVSAIAPAGRIESIRMAHRRAAYAAGDFSHYSKPDQARLLAGKKNI